MRIKYVILIIILGVGIALDWILFMQCEIIEDDTRAILAFISTVGLLFSVFQVVLNIFRQNDIRLKDLRVVEYKEFNNVLNEIRKACDENMIQELENAPNLVFRLFNSTNHFASLIIANDDYLFPNIKETKEALELKETMDRIRNRADKLRYDMEKIDVEAHPVLIMNWHNETRDLLADFGEKRLTFMALIRNKIK
ncbi:MAG: hypothetical protein DWQ02_20125 [Bacteroidetes bacterium]|nr:MAG: hypothetical protein DWQ02_20125 [Bacteroidota bacterium]